MIRVLRRQLAGDTSLLLVALVTAALVALTLAWPRALDRLVRDDLVARAEALPVTQRDLTLTVPYTGLLLDGPPSASASRTLLDTARQWTAAQLGAAGPALAAVLGPAEHEITRAPYFVALDPDAHGISHMTMQLSAGPRQDDLRLVDGAWPTAPDLVAWFDGTNKAGILPRLVMDVVVSTSTADAMGWQVGEVHESLDPSFPVALRLTGLVEPVDPTSGVWDHLPGVVEPAINRDDNAGWTVYGIGYVAPEAVAGLLVPRGVQVDAWYPVDTAAVGRADRVALGAELEGVRATSGLRSDLTEVLATTDGRQRTATTLLAVLVTGLIGAAAGALWLVATLAVERRREALVVLRARGASATRLATLVGAQAAIAALPGAALGVGIATLAPGTTRAGDVVLPAGLTLGAVALVVAAGARVHSGRVGRLRPAGRWRWVVELLVLAGTAAALGAGSRSDPLVTVLPILVGLSAALVALRLYPWPARAALRVSARRGDLGAFLGVARAARVPAAGLVTVLALTLGVATAGLAVTAVGTVAAATERSAVRQVGADLRLDLAWTAQDAGLTPEEVELARTVPGVRDLAPVADAGTAVLRSGRTSRTVHLWVTDGASLAAVQDGLPDGATDLGGPRVLVAPGLPTGAVSLDAPRGAIELEARSSPDVPGTTAGTGWLLIDQQTWAEMGGRPPVNRLLVDVEPGADPSQVATAISTTLDEQLTATSREQAVAALTQGVLVTGVRDAMVLVGAASLVLVALVLGLVLVADAPGRGRAAAVLATLGAPARVHRRLVAAEVVGPVAVATLAGLAAAALLPRVVLRVADLRPFTGALQRPPVVVDPLVLAAGAGVLVLLVGAGVLVAVAAARRVRPVAVLREGTRG